MVQKDNYLSVKNSSNRIMDGHYSVTSIYGISELPTSQNSYPLSSPGLVHDPGYAVDWSAEDQAKLEDGLARFANEPIVMKYVKIAGLLTDKSTRDVAMRCNWMKKKRRKQNQAIADKHMSMRQEIPLKENLAAAPQLNMAQYSNVTYGYHGPFQHFLEENVGHFSRIEANLHSFKLQENLELLQRTRNNIATILNNMTELRGTSSPMPPLPISIDEDLANALLQDPSQTQARMFGFSDCSF